MDFGWLLALDRALFSILNGSFHQPWLDQVWVFLTNVGNTPPLLAATALALVIFGRRRGLVILLGAVATIALSDQLAGHVIKPWVGRERPCHVVPDVVLLVKCTGSPSFPSNHAANAFAAALYFSRFGPPGFTIPAFVLASLVSFSRVAVGVHYPLDLAGGALVGLGCAALVLALMTRIRCGPRPRRPASPPVESVAALGLWLVVVRGLWW